MAALVRLNRKEIVKSVREEINKTSESKTVPNQETNDVSYEIEDAIDWKEKLLNVILKIDFAAFERLCKRLLRESGFVQVELTGKSGGGGIDGKGIVRISGFFELSHHLSMQKIQGCR